MANNASTQGPSGGAAIIDRRRFLKQTALATAVVSVPYLAGKTVAFGKEGTSSGQGSKGADAALDRALKELVAMEGGPPGVIAVVQRGQHRKVHTFGVRNIKSGLPIRVDDRMRIASVAKAFSGAVALSLVSKGALSLNDTIGERLSGLPEPPPAAWAEIYPQAAPQPHQRLARPLRGPGLTRSAAGQPYESAPSGETAYLRV